MFALSRRLYKAGAFFLVSGLLAPAFADEIAQNLGPVGPSEPIVTTVGDKRIIAFYDGETDRCGLNVVVWNRADESGASAAGFRVSLGARQIIRVFSAYDKSLVLQCGDKAETLSILDTKQIVAAGVTE
jgi:hypothetical protein